MLQHQDKNIVTLGEELNFMRSYLYLLKIRFGDAICTEIQVPEQVLSNTMPPNTLQLLVENAVKHKGLSLKKAPVHFDFHDERIPGGKKQPAAQNRWNRLLLIWV